MTKHATLSLLVFLIALVNVNGQNVVIIDNISVGYTNSVIEISYDILNTTTNDLFTCEIEVVNSKSQKIEMRNLSGDVGKGAIIKGGTGKKIYWDVNKEGGTPINDQISAKIVLRPINKLNFSPTLIKSATVPGLGIYSLTERKINFGYSLFTYGLLGTSGYYSWKANETYNNYKAAETTADKNSLYDQALLERNYSLISFGLAGLVYSVNLYSTISKYKKIKRNSFVVNDHNYYQSLKEELSTKQSAFFKIDTRTAFDKLVEQGDELFRDENFNEAILYYKQALSLNLTSNIASLKLQEAEKQLDFLKEKELNYTKLIHEADSFYANNNLTNALISYRKASNLNYNKEYPTSKIKEVERQLQEIENNKRYNDLITLADQYFKNKDYQKSKEKYKEAQKVFPSKDYTYEKIKEIDRITKELEAIKIPLIKNGNTYEIAVKLNDLLPLDFIFDTGADDVHVAPDVFMTLIRTKTITESDIIGEAQYSIADGSVLDGLKFNLRKLEIGGKITLYNVVASVSYSSSAPLLLGGSAFSRIGKITIDYNNDLLIIEKK